MIKNIIFDMGNVLIRFDREVFLTRLGVPQADRELLKREVFQSLEWARMDRGSLTDAQAARSICRRLPEHLHDAAEKLVQMWDRPILPVPGMLELIQELKEKSFATAGILDDAGLEVCIITDAPVIPLYYLPLCAGLAVKAGMKEESAWRAITINPAHVVGIDGRVGSIEAGKDADIAIFEGNPLRDIQCRTKAVFVNGEEVLSQIQMRV